MFLATSRQQTADPSPARDRASRPGRRPGFAHVAFLRANTKASGAAFLSEVVEVFPYRIHTVRRWPAGDQSACWKDRHQEVAWPLPTRPVNRGHCPEDRGLLRWPHLRAGVRPVLLRLCRCSLRGSNSDDIRHRLTKPCHPSTGFSLRSFKKADRWPGRQNDPCRQGDHHQGHHHPDSQARQAHVLAFVAACSVARHLQTL